MTDPRPADSTASRTSKPRGPVDPAAVLERLAALGVSFQRCDHAAVFTVEESLRLVPQLPGAKTKNLFVRDRKGRRHFLVVARHDKRVDLRALAEVLGVKDLSLASDARLAEHLGVTPGSVSVLAVVNDAKAAVEVIVDRDVWSAEAIQAHPLVNTATLVIPRAGLERLLAETGHVPRVVEVPGNAPPARDVSEPPVTQ